ncbi:MAG: hypothetical protein AAF985_24290 [Bacteroidota bacterium]
MKYLFVLALGLFSIQITSAQLSQVLHQTFELDEIDAVSLNIVGEYEIEKWAGNTIMTETSVQIYDASPSIFKHFVREGRYEILGESADAGFKLSSKDVERKTIRTKRGDCYEFIKIRIFVPEDFDLVDNKNLVRREDEVTSENNN